MKMKKLFWLGGILLVSGCFVSTALAAEFRTDKSGSLSIGGDKAEIKNLYTVGNMVSINQDIKKDLLAAGC